MDVNIIVAVIAFFSAVVTGILTHYFNKRAEIAAEWRKEKLNHYKVLLSAISDLGLARHESDKQEPGLKYALASNTVALVAPQDVVTALMRYHNQLDSSNPDRSQQKQEKTFNDLVLAIRKDIGLGKTDNPETFEYHVIIYAPPR